MIRNIIDLIAELCYIFVQVAFTFLLIPIHE